MTEYKYMAVWYDGYQLLHWTFKAENLKDAKEKAFQLMCDNSGMIIWDLQVWECKCEFDCKGEYNPSPKKNYSELAIRDYETGKKIRRGKLSNSSR